MNSISMLVGSKNYDKFMKSWMNEYCFIEGDKERRLDFCEKDFSQILSMGYRHLKYPDIRLVKNGSILREEEITSLFTTEKYGTVRRVSVSKIWDEYRLGSTIVLSAIENLNNILFDLSNKLAKDFGSQIQINAYYSPPNANGFDIHYDLHEVLIFQVYGRKKWYLSPITFQNPLSEHHFSKNDPPKDFPYNSITNIGDMLYIPRGMWHYAVTEREPSLHLTIGIYNKTYCNLIDEVFSVLRDDPLIRSGLPMKFNDNKCKNEISQEILPKIKEIIYKYINKNEVL